MDPFLDIIVVLEVVVLDLYHSQPVVAVGHFIQRSFFNLTGLYSVVEALGVTLVTSYASKSKYAIFLGFFKVSELLAKKR